MRPRIDLDGVALCDEAAPGMVIAIFRWRTAEGLVLLIPECAETSVPWDAIEETSLDLRSGQVRVRFREGWARERAWLCGARTLVGRWLDRYTMTAPPGGARAGS